MNKDLATEYNIVVNNCRDYCLGILDILKKLNIFVAKAAFELIERARLEDAALATAVTASTVLVAA